MSTYLPVLAYQKIGRVPPTSRLKKEWASPRRLEKQIQSLLKRQYTFITPLDLQKQLPAKPVLLAFFGGYQSFYTDVYPLLQKYRICATVLVAVETLGTYNSWQDPHQEPWQNILTSAQLQEMYQSGRVQIGTLGLDGHNLLSDEPTQAHAFLQESVYRLKTLHGLETCALGFWPGTAWNDSRARHIVHGLDLPVFTSQKGRNLRAETHFLRVHNPNFLTQFYF